MSERVTGRTEYQMLMKNSNGEAEIHDLVATRYEDASDKEPWTPATPARIRPSRAKPVQRDHKVYLAFGDEQIDYRRIDNELHPIHDEQALGVLIALNKHLRPDELIGLGDGNDFASLSKFTPDSDQFYRTLMPSFQRKHDLWAQLKADNPEAKRTEVDSNHVKRLGQFVLKHMPEFYNLRRPEHGEDYPIMSYPYLCNFAHLDVNWVSGYGAAEYVINGDLSFRHGTEHSSAATTAAAKALKNRPDINTVQGHDHRESRAFRTLRDGRYIGAIVVGTLARTTGEVPGYHSAVDDLGIPVPNQQNWQQGLLVIRDHGEGNYEYESVPIRNGVGYYQGREYRHE